MKGILIHLKVMVKGYFQSIFADTFYVTLYNEDSVRLYHLICNNSVVHIDATGTIVCNTNSPGPNLVWRSPTLYLTATLHRSISSSYSMLTISCFLNTFRYGETKLTICQPKYVIMDRRSALFGSVLSSFNNESTIDFYKRMYR